MKYKFHDCNSITIWTVFLSKRLRFLVIVFPAFEKICSLGTLVAGIAKKSKAIFDKIGNFSSLIFHQNIGSIFESSESSMTKSLEAFQHLGLAFIQIFSS